MDTEVSVGSTSNLLSLLLLSILKKTKILLAGEMTNCISHERNPQQMELGQKTVMIIEMIPLQEPQFHLQRQGRSENHEGLRKIANALGLN